MATNQKYLNQDLEKFLENVSKYVTKPMDYNKMNIEDKIRNRGSLVYRIKIEKKMRYLQIFLLTN